MKTTVIGSYPKIAEDAYGTKLIGAITRWQKKELTDAELARVVEDVTRAVIQEQEQTGIDIITDGQIRWEDLVTPVVSQWSNVKIEGLTRFFNNNTYYRKPTITAGAKRKANRLVDQWKFAKSVAKSATVKAVLPGPNTVAQLCDRAGYKDDAGFLQDIAQLLREEAEALQKAGAPVLQIDEPSLAVGKPNAKQALAAIHMMIDNLKIPTVVHIYFGAPRIPLEALLEAEVDGIGLDFVEAPELVGKIAKLKWPAKKGLGVGCLDARNTKLEQPAAVQKLLARIADAVCPDEIYVSPNCGLEFLPHDRALAKLKLLSSIVAAADRELCKA